MRAHSPTTACVLGTHFLRQTSSVPRSRQASDCIGAKIPTSRQRDKKSKRSANDLLIRDCEDRRSETTHVYWLCLQYVLPGSFVQDGPEERDPAFSLMDSASHRKSSSAGVQLWQGGGQSQSLYARTVDTWAGRHGGERIVPNASHTPTQLFPLGRWSGRLWKYAQGDCCDHVWLTGKCRLKTDQMF